MGRVEEGEIPTAVYSSGVAFFPPSDRYWRIGGLWYDFSRFDHPGGKQILNMCRDRFEDATFAFEAHHHDFTKARAIIRKYEVPAEVALKTVQPRPTRMDKGVPPNTHFDKGLDEGHTPKLLGPDAFYSVLRRRVSQYLRSVGCSNGGPTTQCIALFWAVFAAWALAVCMTYQTGSFVYAGFSGLAGSVLGAFGHNWVHQPKYKQWGWALLSLDVLGFSSEGWYREHILQHHMFTNTPWDNHFLGTEPFLMTDPTRERDWFNRVVTPHLTPLILCFGIYGNYIAHLVFLLKGQELFSVGKLLLPLHYLVFILKFGLHGALLVACMHTIIGPYYFTLALMNHNAEHCVDVKNRNACKDWGEAQLASSADWGEDLNFMQAGIYLWLNYHTVHHLFPRVDFSHHHKIQEIMLATCKEHGITYSMGHPTTIYGEMIRSFTTPSSLLREISVYSGG